MRSTALENIKQLKNATGCTVNDIVMAICAGALREYLLKHEALPDEPLRAMVPVSLRTGLEEDPWTNRVSAIIADLPTNCDDPLERVRLCHDGMEAAKRQLELVPAESISELAQVAPPLVATAAMRLQSRLRLSDRMNLPVNVTISNVPGPRQALYFAGAKMDNYIPVSIVTDDMGLNITVHSYLDRLDFGLIADRELVPDLWDMVDMHIDEVGHLFEATGAEWAEEQPPPAMRRGGKHVAPKPRSKKKPAKAKSPGR
jgi:diacylglycerol O-acyltransferase